MSHHRDTQQSLLSQIATNTKNVNLNVDSLEVNTDQLETIMTSIDTRLDGSIGHSNNTTGIGDGSNQLRTLGLGYDRTAGQVRSFLIDSAGHQQVDLVSGGDITSKLDTFAGAGNNNVGEGSSKLQIFNYGRDVAAGNFKPMVVNSSAEQIVALSATDNAVLDNISAHTATVDGCVASNKMNVNISSTSGGGLATESTLSAAEVHLGNVETKLGTIETDIEATNTALSTIDGVLDDAEAHLGTIETNTTNSETHLGNIESRLPSALDSGNLKVSIQSGNITGFATATLQGGGLPSALSNDNLKVSIQEGNITGFATASNQSTTNTKLGTIETDIEATNTLLTTIDGVLDNAEAHLGNIETAVQALDNAVDGNYLNVNVNLAGNDADTNSGNKSANTQRVVVATDDVNLSAIKTSVELLDNAVDGNYLNVNLNLAGNDADTNSGNKSANSQRVVIATDDINTSAIASANQLTTTQCHNGVSISGSGGSDTNSTLFTFTHNPKSITIFAADSSGSGSIAGSQIQISPMVSMDNSNFFDLTTAVASGGGSANQIVVSEMLRESIVVIENCRFKFLKVKITNNAGGAINFDSFVCF
jgi:septal ring factor EnvC (AmiA/AmiB activator)